MALCPSQTAVSPLTAGLERISVLCLCRRQGPAGDLRSRLDSLFPVVFAEEDREAIRVAGEQRVGMVIVDREVQESTLAAIVSRQPAPYATTLLILGQDSLAGREIDQRVLVRCLPAPFTPGLLEQMVEDYTERYRLIAAQHELSLRLDAVQCRVEELSQGASDDGIQSTTSLLRLYHVVSGLNGLTTPREIAELVVSTAAGMTRSGRVSLLVPDAEKEYLTIAAAIGMTPEEMEPVRVPIGAPILGEVFASARSMLVRDTLPDDWERRHDAGVITTPPFILMPLVGPDCPVAVLSISEPATPSAYTQEALTALHAITEAAAIALANQIRGQERNDARDGIMIAMAKLAESRDPETGAHLERVQNYCRILAEQLASKPAYRDTITPEFISTLVWSSPLHDIGKVGVPDHILLKPGRLTPEEFAIMRRHSVIGGDTIRSLNSKGRRHDFLQMAMDIAYHHHEKFDGRGYPDGLCGQAIPLAARIMALADVYDALTSVRVYKNAMPHAEAAERIRKDSGSHFDPDVVEAFLSREGEFEKLATELADTIEESSSLPSAVDRDVAATGNLSNSGGRAGTT